MPEQSTKRGDPVTKAAFEGAFETQIVRLGSAGLNLKDELDVLQPGQFARLTNVDQDLTGAATARPGQTSFATGGTLHHSIRKFRQPRTGVDTRVWGVDSTLAIGASGAVTTVDTGYSGSPLALVPHRPPLSGDPWLFVGDANKMRKVRTDGLVLPIGLPKPSAAATAALGREYRRSIANFDTSDATAAANWVPTKGIDAHSHPSGLPSAVDEASTPAGGNDVYFTSNDGSIDSTYDCWLGCPISRDLTTLSPTTGAPGDIAASDDDVIHLWMKTSNPALVKELRIYLVVNAVFDPTGLPGVPKATGGNSDAYVKGFRQNDFVQFIQATQTQIDAAETARIFATRDQDLKDRAITDKRTSWTTVRAMVDPSRARSIQIGAGGHQWFELGSIGLSLRRRDFQRIGSTSGRDWSTVTGIIVYMKMEPTDLDRIVSWALDDLYLTGGYGPDTVESGAQPYDYRTTHYDPRTGAESNGSDTMATTAYLDSRRQQIVVTPAAYGSSAIRQRVYRRGGSLITNWFYLGVTTSDGGAFTDTFTDDAIAAAGTLPIDHYQPVPTVDANGNTVLAQPLPALWGPLEGMLMGCGDPYRPGHLYWSLPDSPDHWSSSSYKEVCPPSEELMAGGVMGQQAFVFSRLRLYLLYPNFSNDARIDYAPSLCKRGIRGRTHFCVGPGGIYFYAEGEGIFLTTGGPEEWISRDIDPIFQGVTRYGYLPIDSAAPTAIRLTCWENQLVFLYQDTSGARQVMVYSILHKHWRAYSFGRALATVQGEEETDLLLGSLNLGTTYTHIGTSDAGLAIACTARTGAFTGGRREEKLFGDQILRADRAGVSLSVQNFLNVEAITNPVQTLNEGTGRQAYILDAFGESPQKANAISTEISWSSATARPILYELGYAITVQPEITNKRVTNWDDLGSPDEFWLSGVTFDVDTGNVARTIIIERDFNGVRDTVATLTVLANNRHKLQFSWPAVSARQVRVRPTDDCKFWLLYRADWIAQGEPPRIAKWDIHFENKWDQYHTGLDLYCDTGGLEKRIEVYVDEVRLSDPQTGLAYWAITANGRRVVHITLPWGRGHVYRFRAIDDNPGLLYNHRWHLDPEPSEQWNWNQNFSIYGTRADKWLKAILFECDTFGQNKSVTVEADGVVVETITVNASGRKVVQKAIPQHLGRVWRMFPVDGNPGRLYTAQPVFDEEPYQLDRWETQEINYSLPGWFYPTYGHLVLKSTKPVTLTLARQYNQRGGTRTETYTIPATGGQKIRWYQTFQAGRDVFHKWLVTSAEPFWLYRDETIVWIQPWGADQPKAVQPFGNDDIDPTRTMTNATFAAQTSGGGTQ